MATRFGNKVFFHNRMKNHVATIENTITNRSGTGKDRAIPVLKCGSRNRNSFPICKS